MVLILLARIWTISSLGPDIKVLSFFCMVGDNTSTLDGGLTSPFWILIESGRLLVTIPVGAGGAGIVGGGGRTGGAGKGLLTFVIGGCGISSVDNGGGGPGGGGGTGKVGGAGVPGGGGGGAGIVGGGGNTGGF